MDMENDTCPFMMATNYKDKEVIRMDKEEEEECFSNEDEGEQDLEELEAMRNSLLAELQQQEDEESDDEQEQEQQTAGRSCSQSEYDDDEDDDDEGMDAESDELDSLVSDEEGQLEESVIKYGELVEDIDNMLETPVEQQEGDGNNRPNKMSKRLKRVLDCRGMDHFDVLPDGWVEITHSSGLPVYLHRPSRCCTFSRPYFIGRGSVRNHKVPESAIPCLFQRKVHAEMEKNEQINKTSEAENAILNRLSAPNIKVKTEADLRKSQLNPDQLYEYAKRCFKFKNICVFRFHKWSEARNFYKRKKARKAFNQSLVPSSNGEERPSLHPSVKLITVPALEADSKPHKRVFYLNPQGKTSVSILHEFVQKVLKCTVRYFFNETRSSATPYHCVVKLVHSNNTPLPGSSCPSNEQLTRDLVRRKLEFLQSKTQQNDQKEGPNDDELVKKEGQNAEEKKANDEEELITLGEGMGAGKKSAKLIAAKDALQKLVKGVDFDEEGIAIGGGNRRVDENGTSSKIDNQTKEIAEDDPLHIFDLLDITDTRIQELSARAGQPSPYLILQEYLKRCSAYGDTALQLTTHRLRHQRHEFTLSLGDNLKVRVVSTNKREGKQKAAQAMLKKLHPESTSWGSLLRLYGYEAQQKLKEARKRRDSVTKLQGIADEHCHGKQAKCGEFQPNGVILDKLRSEMLKLSEGLIAQNLIETNQKIDEQLSIDKLMGTDEDQPKPKMRRMDFQWELPILSEEKLRELSAKLETKYPDDHLAHIPSLKF